VLTLSSSWQWLRASPAVQWLLLGLVTTVLVVCLVVVDKYMGGSLPLSPFPALAIGLVACFGWPAYVVLLCVWAASGWLGMHWGLGFFVQIGWGEWSALAVGYAVAAAGGASILRPCLNCPERLDPVRETLAMWIKLVLCSVPPILLAKSMVCYWTESPVIRCEWPHLVWSAFSQIGGIFCFIPLVIVGRRALDGTSWSAFWLVKVPMLIGGAAVLLLVGMLARTEQLRVERDFSATGALAIANLRKELFDTTEDLALAAGFALDVEDPATARARFSELGNIIHSHSAGVQAVTEIVLIENEQRAEVEARMAEEYPEAALVKVHGVTESGGSTVSAPQDWYAPVRRIYPFRGNEKALGLDVLHHEPTRSSVRTTLTSGRPVVTQPIRLVQEPGLGMGVVLYYALQPVPEWTGNPAERGRPPRILSVVFRGKDFLRAVWEPYLDTRIQAELTQIAEDGSRQLLGSLGADLKEIEAVTHVERFEFGEQLWEARLSAPASYLASHRSWALWLSYPLGVAFIGLLAVFVLGVFRRRVVIENRVQLRTEELFRAKEQAERSERAKTEFLAMMSHEIRTPMNGMIGTSELLLKSEVGDEERRMIEMIHASSETLLTIVNDILDFSKLEAGRLELDCTTFEMRDLIRRIETLLTRSAADRSLKLSWAIAPEADHAYVGDFGRLIQILLNLGNNAVKFTTSGSVCIAVDANSKTSSCDVVRIRVIDTGIGISPEQQERVFQMFTQADASTTRRYGGTGLGLAIARRLADLMGGQLKVKSELGKGSEFILEVPLARAVAGKTEGLPAAEPQGMSLPRGERLLLVEDNKINQRVAEVLLKRLGYTAEVAEDGAEALASWHTGKFRLVLLDCQLPGMDGFEVAREIRKQEANRKREPGKRTYIIALTANRMAGDRERCLEAGMDDYLSKPVRLGDLRTVLQRWNSAEA